MDGLDPETQAFRTEVLAFCRDHLPPDIRRKVELHLELERDDYTRWQKVLHARGWIELNSVGFAPQAYCRAAGI